MFQVRSGDGTTDPRVYTVEPQRQLTDSWPLDVKGAYDLAVHGPNGFYREFKGSGQALEVSATYDTRRHKIHLTLINNAPARVTVAITDAYAGHSSTVRLKPGEKKVETRSLGRTHGWYDLAVTIQRVAGYRHQFAGHVENGKASISDPLMGGLVHGHRHGQPDRLDLSNTERGVAPATR